MPVGFDMVTPNGARNRSEVTYYSNGQIYSTERSDVDKERRAKTYYYWYSDGRLWGKQSPDDRTLTYEYNTRSASVIANKFTSTQSGLHSSSTITNMLGQVTRTIDEEGIPVRYRYDAHGNLTETRVNDNRSSDIVITYNHLGQRKRIQDPDMGVMALTYTGFGELRSQTWAPDNPSADKSMTHYYDKLGRLNKRVDMSPKGKRSEHKWTWDSKWKGRLSEIRSHINGSDQKHKETYEYNRYGEVKHATTKIGDFKARFEYTYDHFGREDTTTYPDGFVTKKTYFGSGFPLELEKIGDKPKRIYLHNEDNFNGEFEHLLYGNNVVSTRRYNAIGQLTNIHTGDYDSGSREVGRKVQSLEYGYDGFGNLRERKSRASPSGPLTETFTYDKINRIKTATMNGYNYFSSALNTSSKHYYHYDKLGNLVYRSDKGIVDGNRSSARNIWYSPQGNGEK